MASLETRVEAVRLAALTAGEEIAGYVYVADEAGFFRVKVITKRELEEM